MDRIKSLTYCTAVLLDLLCLPVYSETSETVEKAYTLQHSDIQTSDTITKYNVHTTTNEDGKAIAGQSEPEYYEMTITS